MPIYSYKCVKCGISLMLNRSIDDRDYLPNCPKCKQPMNRIYSFSETIFKGKGFYRTDKDK